ncbi:MAG: ferrous iron transport protein B [Saprospiraceae bacterium]
MFKVGLLGNPNSGKSSLFNQLTGLRQKVGNFPGVTVEKKIGTAELPNGDNITIVDFPGTYSLHPNSHDERVVLNIVSNPNDENYPDAVIYVADVMNLEKHLLLFTQLRDLDFPIVLALSMSDVAKKENLEINPEELSKNLDCPVVSISSRTGQGIDKLLGQLVYFKENLESFQAKKSFYTLSKHENDIAKAVQIKRKTTNNYQALLQVHHHDNLPYLNDTERSDLHQIGESHNYHYLRGQINETMQRFDKFTPIVNRAILNKKLEQQPETITDKIDRWVIHPIFGPIIFFSLMLLIFQAIFTWSGIPMDLIEGGFELLTNGVKSIMPESLFRSLLTDGLIAGLGGVLIFIPQIAILFFLIAILEEIGYMARAVFMFDRIMQKFGLNGRSIVALISGGACAIPAVMSTRTISNWKERLITIMVTPLISCSARIPVYIVLIGFVVPSVTIGGLFNAQALIFMGLYLLGIIAALGSAYVFNKILKTNEQSFLMIHLPNYRTPEFKNIGFIVWEKVRAFTVEAGKIILVVSLVLWVLASFGPSEAMQNAKNEALTIATEQQLDETQREDLLAAKTIEASYAGHLGKFIEPAIRPLGFDWKIGIALITSFAAREVFVGTMATIYSIGSVDDEGSIRDKMAKETRTNGKPVYDFATALSLLLFYVFAMQCMSTLAVVKRETNSWKWPTIQFLFMSAMAYFSSLAVYQIFS